MQGTARERYHFGDWTLDVGAAIVEGESVGRVPLPKLSFDLLVALVRRAPDVVSLDELADAVWAGAEISDETVVQRVALLRRALGDSARDSAVIRSVRGRGYQLVPAVERVEASASSAPAAAMTAESIADRLPGGRSRRRWGLGLGLGLVVTGLAVGVWALRPSERVADRQLSGSPVATRPPALEEWLERADTYLASQREADNELALGLYERALELDPDHLEALTGASLAHSYRTTRFNHPNSEADRAEALALRALAAQPTHARAHRALGLARNARGRIDSALAAYDRAIELDPSDVAARSSAAYLLMVRGRLAEALERHVELLGFEQSSTYLDVQMAGNLALLDFDEPAAVWFERAVLLRPDSVFAAIELARWHFSKGRIEAADRVAQMAVERHVRRPELLTVRGDVAWLAGQSAIARELYSAARQIDPSDSRSRARLLVLQQQPNTYAAAISAIRKARKSGDQWPTDAIDAAILHAGFGRDEEAYSALDVAIDLGFRDLDAITADPVLGALIERDSVAMAPRLQRIRDLVAAERQRVLGASWLPASLLSVGETPGNAGSR